MAQDSSFFKSGELMLSKAEMVKHSESPVKEILNKTGELFKTIGIQQANFETTIHHVLDEEKINKSTKDYFQAENEMNELKRNSGARQGGVLAYMSAHGRTLNSPPLKPPTTSSTSSKKKKKN
jgi:hypothetical protein